MLEGKYANVKRAIVLTLYISLTSIVASFALFAGRGQDIPNILTKVIFYYALMFFGFIGLIALAISTYISSKGKPNALAGLSIHEPKANIFNDLNIPHPKFLDDGRILFMVFFVIFFVAGLYATYQETFFTASLPFGEIEFQATKTADTALQVYPASPAETLVFTFLVFLSANLLRYFIVVKGKQPKAFYWFVNIFIIAPGWGLGWLAYHLYRYGSDQTALLGNFIFGTIGSLLNLVFASVIPWLLLHDFNNFFEKINKLFSNETILGIYGVVLIFIIIPLFAIWIYRIRRKRNVTA